MSLAPPRRAGGDDDVKHKCIYCKQTFNDSDALRDHKIKLQDQEWAEAHPDKSYILHNYCQFCDCDSITSAAAREHWLQYHSEKQDVNCPGCNKHFVHFSSFVRHIEFHDCPFISKDDVAARCQKELDFARALQHLDRQGQGVNRKKDFSVFLNPHPAEQDAPLPARLAIENGPSAQWPAETQIAVPQKSDFPPLSHNETRHGGSKVPDLLSGDETQPVKDKEGGNCWAPGENPFANAPPAQRPTDEQMMQLQTLWQNEEMEREQKAIVRAKAVIKSDPRDPAGQNFDPGRLYCKYTKSYKCPICKTKKGFKSWPALQQHIQSAAHSFTKTVSCPNCLDNFSHLFALAAHVESADKKCQLKHSDVFEIFLGQLTWNLIEVKGTNADNTPKFVISEKAKNDFGPVKPAQGELTFGHHQVYGARPQLTQGALSSLDKASALATQSHASVTTPSAPSSEFPALPNQQRPLTQFRPPQIGNDSRSKFENQAPWASHAPARQIQSQCQDEVRPSQYGDNGRVLYQAEPPRDQLQTTSRQGLDQSRSLDQAAQPQAQQLQYGGVGRAAYQAQQPRVPAYASQGQSQTQGQQQYQTGLQEQSWPQTHAQGQGQQPGRTLGTGLTATALAQVSAYPGASQRKNEGDAACWSDAGDAGDAGW